MVAACLVLLIAKITHTIVRYSHIISLTCNQRSQVAWQRFLEGIGVRLLGEIFTTFALVENRHVIVGRESRLHRYPAAMRSAGNVTHIGRLAANPFYLDLELMLEIRTLRRERRKHALEVGTICALSSRRKSLLSVTACFDQIIHDRDGVSSIIGGHGLLLRECLSMIVNT